MNRWLYIISIFVPFALWGLFSAWFPKVERPLLSVLIVFWIPLMRILRMPHLKFSWKEMSLSPAPLYRLKIWIRVFAEK